MKETNTYHEGMEDLNLPQSLRVNPFSVPADYFEGLAAKTNAHALFDKINQDKPSFSVPTNYFDNLSQTLLAQVSLVSKVIPLENAGMNVPQNYFEQLSASITSQTKLDDLHAENTHTVPDNYFETLGQQIQHRIEEEKLRERIAVTGFTTPEGYFESLTKSINAEIQQPEKIIKLPQRAFQRWIQYVAAACVTMLLGIGSYYAINTAEQKPAELEQLAAVSDEEILNYLAYSMDCNDLMYVMEAIYQPKDEEEVVKHVDKDDIKDYLKYML